MWDPSDSGYDPWAEPDRDDLANDVTDEQRAAIKEDLSPGEEILWAERACPPPVPVIRVVPALFTAFLCGVSGFALAVLFGIYGLRVMTVAETLFVLGLAPAALGLVIAAGLVVRYIHFRRLTQRLARTFYALTDRRVIVGIDSPGDGADAISGSALALGMFDDTLCVEHRDGSGDVFFTSEGSVVWPETSFIGVASVRQVDRLVREALFEFEMQWNPRGGAGFELSP
jgi:hypothetical protein